MKAKIGVSLTSDILRRARVLAEEQGITLSGLISTLIYREFKERVVEEPKTNVKPIGRPRHTAEDKEIIQLIERAEKLSAYWKDQLESGKFVDMFNDLLGKLYWAKVARDVPTLKTLAEGNTWEKAVDAYYEREKEEERNGTT